MTDEQVKGEQVARTLVSLGQLALDLQGERDQAFRRQGGVTPEDMQNWLGRFLEQANPQMRVVSFAQGLRQAATDLEEARYDEREIAASVLFMLMHLAHLKVFDLYDCAYEQMSLLFMNAITRGKEAQGLLEA